MKIETKEVRFSLEELQIKRADIDKKVFRPYLRQIANGIRKSARKKASQKKSQLEANTQASDQAHWQKRSEFDTSSPVMASRFCRKFPPRAGALRMTVGSSTQLSCALV